MSTSKHFDKICVVVTLLALLITILFMNGEALGIQKIVDEDADAYKDSQIFTSNDLNGDWDDTDATLIALNGDSVHVSGVGAYADGGSVYISSAGDYVLSGTLNDGNIVVDAYKASRIRLKLNGVSVFCPDDACLRVDQADKVFLTLADGTENFFSSGSALSAEAAADNTNGAIFSHDDLTINGSGSLTIDAGYRHGITAKDDLVITGGTIDITAPADGLHVNDSFNFANASLTIDAGDDGIHSDTAVYIESGEILIDDCYEGIEALTIDVCGGDITIYPSDDGFNANGASFGFGGSMSGGFNSMRDSQERDGASTESAEKDNAETAVADSWIHVSGGSITIINENAQDADGLDSNGDIIISGGTIRISLVGNGSNSALDCGSENGGVMEISGGTVIACGASAMAESFDTTSTQASILYNTSETTTAKTPIALEDASGNILLDWEVPCSFSSMVLSCPAMQLNESYLVVIGDNVEEITLDEISASYGSAQSGGFGGSMNWGGMQNRASFGGMQSGGRGDMGGRGEMPDLSEMPTPPDREDSGDFSSRPDMRGGMGFPGGENAQRTESVSTGTSLADFSAETWLLLGASGIILLAGLAAAIAFRRRR